MFFNFFNRKQQVSKNTELNSSDTVHPARALYSICKEYGIAEELAFEIFEATKSADVKIKYYYNEFDHYFECDPDFKSHFFSSTKRFGDFDVSIPLYSELVLIFCSEPCLDLLFHNDVTICARDSQPLPIKEFFGIENNEIPLLSELELEKYFDLLYSKILPEEDNFLEFIGSIILQVNEQVIETDKIRKGYSSVEDYPKDYPAITYNICSPHNKYCYSDIPLEHTYWNSFAKEEKPKVIYAYSVLDTIKHYIASAIKYSYVSVPINNFIKIYNLEVDDGESLSHLVSKKFGNEIDTAIRNCYSLLCKYD